jgi:hypothetical protein
LQTARIRIPVDAGIEEQLVQCVLNLRRCTPVIERAKIL